MEIEHFILKKNGGFPNNALLPVLLYKNVLQVPDEKGGKFVQKVFEQNNWGNTWTDGIYSYHHYHSITHEAVGIISGHCNVMLGGENGQVIKVNKGDVLILPAGTAHKNVGASEDFCCAGGYPGGKDYDINYGTSDEHPLVDENIKQVPLPETDPVFGKEGMLFEYWLPETANVKRETKT